MKSHPRKGQFFDFLTVYLNFLTIFENYPAISEIWVQNKKQVAGSSFVHASKPIFLYTGCFGPRKSNFFDFLLVSFESL